MATNTSRQLMSASTLTGDEIRNPQGDSLGNVHDIMIDCDSGRVGYVVMTSGGFLGMGNKLFAIPMSALQLDTSEHCLRMNASKETFKNAPGFDKDHWPDLADPQWERSIYGHYGVTPYWE